MAPLPLVLRLPRAEINPDPRFILLHVSQHQGTAPLDLKLVGTEASEVFTVSIKHSKVSAFKAKSSKSSNHDWETVLAAVLRDEIPKHGAEADITTLLEGVEAVTEVVEGSSMTITIQKRIEGITQRLGQILLQVTEDEEVELYEWCSITVESRNTCRQEVTHSQNTLKSKDDEIKKLEDALAELTTLKTKNEDALLEKFSLLLNEKKLKIREQQKLLAASTITASSKADVEDDNNMDVDTPSAPPPPQAGPSRPRKRKASAKKEVAQSSDSDDGFEKMEVQKPGTTAAGTEDEGSDRVDERTASETESDSDSDTGPPATLPKRTKSPPRPKKKASTPPVPPTRKTRAQTAEKVAEDEEVEAKTPPKRELPFARKPPAAGGKEKEKIPSPTAGGGDGSETESDDEL